MSAPENGRISVSEDKLRAVIAEFELRLRDFIEAKVIGKADLETVATALTSIEKHGERIDSLESWRENQRAVALSWKTVLVGAAMLLGAGWWIPELIHRIIHPG